MVYVVEGVGVLGMGYKSRIFIVSAVAESERVAGDLVRLLSIRSSSMVFSWRGGASVRKVASPTRLLSLTCREQLAQRPSALVRMGLSLIDRRRGAKIYRVDGARQTFSDLVAIDWLPDQLGIILFRYLSSFGSDSVIVRTDWNLANRNVGETPLTERVGVLSWMHILVLKGGLKLILSKDVHIGFPIIDGSWREVSEELFGSSNVADSIPLEWTRMTSG
ncbi:hypothetical protein Tco_0536887 [Tanacetum coccineum]